MRLVKKGSDVGLNNFLINDMLYNIYIYTSVPGVTKVVEAEDHAAAQEIAENLEKKRRRQLKNELDFTIKSRVTISDDNYRSKIGGVYLIKRYSKEISAKCISSGKYGRQRRWKHVFRYLDTSRIVTLTSKARIVKILCEDSKIGNDNCGVCPSRFYCYTNKKKL